jgi:Ser/Thr protein kinase RdoA (MazF antagonist)
MLRTPHGKYVLRQVSHTHHKTPRDLEFELDYLDYLKHAGFPYDIPSAVATKNDGFFVTGQGHYYWLYKFLEGVVLERPNEPHLAQLAEMMASYHKLLERSALNNGKPASDLYNRAATLKEIEENRKEILQKTRVDRNENIFLEESAKLTQILRGLDEGPYSRLRFYPIHRDLNSENLIWKQDKLAGVIDFENVSGSNDPVVKDIAVTMQYCCRNKRVRYQLDIDLAKRFLQSYKKHRSLSDQEVRLIPDLVTAGFVEDFAYAFWMLRNDPQRANAKRLTLYSRAGQWVDSNKEKIVSALLI